MSDFFALLSKGEFVYMADVSIANYFPWLFQHVKIPRHFLHDFNHRTRQQNFAANNTPSLFIGAQGTRTSLHIDQLSSNFWMLVCEGRKHWTTFHPEDTELLSPEFDDYEQIYRFRDLEVLEEDQLSVDKLRSARKLEFVLEEGEVLFIPQGTPHQVRNLTPTVAVSSNFTDQSNITATLAQLVVKMAHVEEDKKRHAVLDAFFTALNEIDWPEL